ncbi:MAG: TldD/PmbA family protein [Tistlia sp.]|uniref:TldD/PmbA family protein n=1 Tax=Tistlia sp. TaxID=3057121 RepID=UPI0034A19143
MAASDDDGALLQRVLDKARRAGAESADALVVHATAISHAQRLGQVERLEREEAHDLGLRVFIGHRQAIVSSTDFAGGALDELVERAVAMARAVPEDSYCGLADPAQIAREIPDLDALDPEEPSTELLIERARACEAAARAVPGTTNSEGAEASWSSSRIAVAASNGFSGSYAGSRHSLGVAILAGEGLAMERDYDFSSAVYGSDLRDPEEVGRSAGEKAVRRLKPRKPKTGRVPIVLDPRVANSLLRSFAGAITGTAIARGTSFLKDKRGEQVFAKGLQVIDDPHRARGLRSKPFDAEGLATGRRALIEDGVLTGWLLDLASARQLGLPPTGNASRGVSGPPGPSASNLYLAPGTRSPQALIGEIEEGFYVTEMMGMGANGVTGDYSRGASGFWIEKGELAYPVSEATVAGNLKTMFLNLTPADDLVLRYGTDSPTVRIDGMTVAGA